MRPVDRRTFLREVAPSRRRLLHPSSPRTECSPRVPPTDMASRQARSGRTPCRLCGVGCGLLVAIENGRAVAVKGDPASPVSKGLACVKGYYSVQALYGRDRITHAMIRRAGGALGRGARWRSARPGGAAAFERPSSSTARTASRSMARRSGPFPTPTWRRSSSRELWHEQRRDQRAALRGQRHGWPREQLRPRRRDRLLRGHRPRGRLRALGRRTSPRPIRFSSRRMLDRRRQPRRSHHRSDDAHHANELRRRPLAVASRRIRRCGRQRASVARSSRANGSIAISSIGTLRSSGARQTSVTASPTTASPRTTPRPYAGTIT